MNDSEPTDPSPVEFTVQVLRHKPNPETRALEPWPMATVDISQAGTVTFKGDASKAYGPMQQAFEAVVTAFARAAAQAIHHKFIENADQKL